MTDLMKLAQEAINRDQAQQVLAELQQREEFLKATKEDRIKTAQALLNASVPLPTRSIPLWY